MNQKTAQEGNNSFGHQGCNAVFSRNVLIG